ncbi:heme exporter protein CcmD [Teredinibacter franksiae]|uniref:heme exporter protein CcmD n=1 Tax=Teredinibacter franksiae TaxID=2761453 RepID=UPI00162518BA|nr:heme exporter protein CcmD [Teredinibacter franksiae]
MSLSFQFADFQAFIAMGGHGIYVWLCYGIVITGLLGLVIAPVINRKKFIKSQQSILRRQASQNQAH